MRCILGPRGVEHRTRPDEHPREERNHPNRRHTVPSVVRIGSCPARLEEARRQGCRRCCCLKGEDGADGEDAPRGAQIRGKNRDAKIDPLLETHFGAGRLYAAISSRSGQVSRAKGYIRERKELEVRSVATNLYSLLVV